MEGNSFVGYSMMGNNSIFYYQARGRTILHLKELLSLFVFVLGPIPINLEKKGLKDVCLENDLCLQEVCLQDDL